MFKSLEEKIKFRDKYIYEREDELKNIVTKYKIDNIYVEAGQIKINFNINTNKHLKDKKDEILKQFKQISFVDEIFEKGRFIYILHSRDVGDQLDDFYSGYTRFNK